LIIVYIVSRGDDVMEHDYPEYVHMLKALSDETRLRIVDILSNGEMCACKILEKFNITQPTLSYHMKILTGSGLVDGRRDGAWMRYTLNKNRTAMLKDFMDEIVKAEKTEVCDNCKAECK
jgi:ArsR family transcriptional regulator